MAAPLLPLAVRGDKVVDSSGTHVRLRGTCVGGWMNMEDFISGHPGAEHALRSTLADVLGPDRAAFFLDRLLDYSSPRMTSHS
jgi:endoglucanase